MKVRREKQKKIWTAVGFLAAFMLWTAVVSLVDVREIGPESSAVGLAGLNAAVHGFTGVHMALYVITDWLSLVPAGFMLYFACLGLWQWVKRRSLLAVDRSLIVLGGFYVAVLAAYAFFEVFVVNYRPVLIDGVLEASYPSSTTMLVLCVMPTAMMQLKARIRAGRIKRCVLSVMAVYTAGMVMIRLVSGVHWLSDIVGGILLSTGLVMLYQALEHKD